MRTAIVIPMHNEEKIARESMTTILPYLRQLPAEVKLVVIDDGSLDRTRMILEQCRAQDPDRLVLIVHERNKGYGAALRTGVTFAAENGFEYILFMDSDLTNHPKYLKDFYEKISQGYDYIKANRYAPGAGVSGVPWQRRAVSLVGNKVARMLFGLPIHDLTNGFRAVKTSLIKDIRLTENGFAIIMEELCLLKPVVRSYAEIPYVLTSRSKGQGKTHFTYDLKTYFSYLKYAVKSMVRPRPIAQTKKGKT